MAEHIDDPTLLLNGEAIVKWRNQPSILAIASEYKNRANFSFNFVSGVPQGSILGSLSFDIFMCDMLLKSKATNFTGYGDDDTQFVLEIT